jgi:CheY-like chemotaxis protein
MEGALSFLPMKLTRPAYTVLLVDDDDQVRRVLACMLSDEGHEVVEASDGISALRLMHSTVVDLVITDIVMPQMEGLEFLRILHKRPDRPRVIAISGGGRGSTTDYLELAKNFGADAILPKPFAKKELVVEIEQVMAKELRSANSSE